MKLPSGVIPFAEPRPFDIRVGSCRIYAEMTAGGSFVGVRIIEIDQNHPTPDDDGGSYQDPLAGSDPPELSKAA